LYAIALKSFVEELAKYTGNRQESEAFAAASLIRQAPPLIACENKDGRNVVVCKKPWYAGL
jgi:hypothetical protein